MKYHWGYVVVPFCLLSELVFREKDATGNKCSVFDLMIFKLICFIKFIIESIKKVIIILFIIAEAEYDEETFNLKDHSFKIAFMIIHSSILLILIY